MASVPPPRRWHLHRQMSIAGFEVLTLTLAVKTQNMSGKSPTDYTQHDPVYKGKNHMTVCDEAA